VDGEALESSDLEIVEAGEDFREQYGPMLEAGR
jgi:hypothetical protein